MGLGLAELTSIILVLEPLASFPGAQKGVPVNKAMKPIGEGVVKMHV